MTQILIPTESFEDWGRLVAYPERHWKPSFSAMTLARAWEDAKSSGFPPEVTSLLQSAGRTDWKELRALIAIPEYKVALPGGSRGSQTDLAVLARGQKGLLAIAVEGKVDESLGPTVGKQREDISDGASIRLKYLCDALGIHGECPPDIRYQLLHRAVSAIEIARDFSAESAAMIVHSFSPNKKWLSDFQSFAALLGVNAQPGTLVSVGQRGGVQLYLGWVAGDQKFRSVTPFDNETRRQK